MMEFLDLMKAMAPVVTILASFGAFGVVVVRWVVRESTVSIEKELQSIALDVRMTLARLESTVAHHHGEIETLKAKVDSLRDDKAGKGELDLRVQVEVQREVGKILASAPHNIPRNSTPGG